MLFFIFKKFPIGLKENLREEDNLSTGDNWPVPNVSFVRRFYCRLMGSDIKSLPSDAVVMKTSGDLHTLSLSLSLSVSSSDSFNLHGNDQLPLPSCQPADRCFPRLSTTTSQTTQPPTLAMATLFLHLLVRC